ncbi:MAG: 4-alpha-glucanotransferase [Chitinophagaceae bacterium]|nr:MAG: 4-alpha-glucanotransferase [Chitinophagaceae bacterium]
MHIYFELSFDPPPEIKAEAKVYLAINGNKNAGCVNQMLKVAANRWSFEMEFPGNRSFPLEYHYLWQINEQIKIPEEKRRRVVKWMKGMPEILYLADQWNHPSEPQNALLKAPFTKAFLQRKPHKKLKSRTPFPPAFTHLFNVMAPGLEQGKSLCLLGNKDSLNHWDIQHPVIMQQDGNKWFAGVNFQKEDNGVVEYKYGVYDTAAGNFLFYEEGENRKFTLKQEDRPFFALITDNFCRLTKHRWRGGGVSVPVFSLRSKESMGIGEFSDIKLLVDWAERTGLRIIQILPVNDTSATKTWRDSYPYAAISAFALNPVYINLRKTGTFPADHPFEKKYNKTKEHLNFLPEIDYESVLSFKWEYLKALYKIFRKSFWEDKRFKSFFEQNKRWLLPYAVFCCLRDRSGTTDYSQFAELSIFDEEKVNGFASPKQPWFDQIAIHYFVQFHLHLQLDDAVRYAHKKGVALKGDIPIGIYRYSADAWMNPGQFFLNMQAGAPPDGFAMKGQNWRFPAYNWEKMESEGFEWWKNRLQHLSLYFDAMRFDHILGFFRIWQIPSDEIEGIMGHFYPSKPLSIHEFRERGISFNESRFCKPMITSHLLDEYFNHDALEVKQIFFEEEDKGHYKLRAKFNTQREIDNFFREKEKEEHPLPGYWKQGLFDLISNVLFFHAGIEGTLFHPRFGMMETPSFLNLPEEQQQRLRSLHDDYFYHRHEKLWQEEALRKLPSLKGSTDMLVCGEDLGMMPHSVPETMQFLGLLSLEVQRMPKQWGREFMNMKEVPYLSVVTTGTHDMNTLRSWWEEDRGKTQRFYNEIMLHHGTAPYFCEPWVVKEIMMQHFQSNAMLAIIPLQDLIGMSGAIRRENPHDERINIPANPEHYWRYRMHITLEQLLSNNELNETIKGMIASSNR